ncbi:hypothetical protein LDC_0029 [sediment metagenome]|uniref:Uncharacterized protein n=1 Tax=sediment metagenome TaxID=749907 RepID=D9PEV1_9ZZZZ
MKIVYAMNSGFLTLEEHRSLLGKLEKLEGIISEEPSFKGVCDFVSVEVVNDSQKTFRAFGIDGTAYEEYTYNKEGVITKSSRRKYGPISNE